MSDTAKKQSRQKANWVLLAQLCRDKITREGGIDNLSALCAIAHCGKAEGMKDFLSRADWSKSDQEIAEQVKAYVRSYHATVKGFAAMRGSQRQDESNAEALTARLAGGPDCSRIGATVLVTIPGGIWKGKVTGICIKADTEEYIVHIEQLDRDATVPESDLCFTSEEAALAAKLLLGSDVEGR